MGYSEEELEQQQKLHSVIEETLQELGDLKEGQLLTGWVICFEAIDMSDETENFAGSFYGPREMSTWRALGLLEWVRRFSLRPGDDEGDGLDD